MIGAKRKGSISEEDTSVLLQRYTATTILALLQEVYQFSAEKIDWNALVKRTSTGISSPREYQMLWRHLAYRDPLLEKLEDGAEPLDDDSDIEFELEAVPAVSEEASLESAACVKVLISSGLPNDCGPQNRSTVEAPLTINIPNGQTSCAPLDEQQVARSNRGTNITVPVSVQKQPLPTGASTDAFDGNASTNSGAPAKKKRKLWTKEEDEELIAAVQKYGEGNWTAMLKGDFKHERTTSQLAQRWNIIKKRQGILTSGGGNIATGSTQSEQVLATRKAVSMALNMPTLGSLSATNAGVSQTNTPPTSSALAVPSEAPPVSASQALQEAPNQAATQKGAPMPSNKSRITIKRVVESSKPLAPQSTLQAAAIAAGGRIAPPSTAASFIQQATRFKAAVHIRPPGSALSKPPVTGTKFLTTCTSGMQPRYARPKVMPPPPAHSSILQTGLKVGGQQVQESSGRLASQTPPTTCVAASNLSAQQMVTESKPGSLTCTALQENASKTKNEISAINLDDMEVDDVVPRDQKTSVVVGESDHKNGNACEHNANFGLHKDPPNSGAVGSQSIVNDADGALAKIGTGAKSLNGEAGERSNGDHVSRRSHDMTEERSGCLEAKTNVQESVEVMHQ